MSYTKTTWQDLPNTNTPITASRLNNMENGIKNNDTNIGEENYDNTRTYEVGDIVRYNEKIYKCITAITTAENFDNSKWEQTNIVEIVQSEKSKIYELIEAISTPIVGEGENITLNDTAEKRFENFDIEGNSEQETRSGKNLIDESNISEAASSEGIRYNGSYVYDNTPNSDSRGWTYDNCNYYLSLPAGTYTLSLNFRKKITNNVGGLFRFYKPDNTFIGNLSGLNVDYASVSFTLTETTNLGLYFKLMDGQVNIQLEEGSTATPYEQYGASPSPDYPSEVKSCGDNINIFDITKYDYRNNAGATAQITNETTFRITATMNDNANCAVGFKILDLTNYAGKTLSVKAFVKSSTDTNNGFMVLRQNNSDYSGTHTNIVYDDSQRTTDGVITLNYKVASTINDSNRYLFIHFYATRGTVCNIGDYVDYKVKLSEGIDGEGYSEYGQGCITEIIANKNFFDKDNTEWIRNNSADYHSTDNSNTIRIRTKNLIKLKGSKTYTISGMPNGISFNSAKFYVSPESTANDYFITTSTFTVPSDATYAIFQFAGANFTDTTNILMKNANIQLEEGSTATTYIEHQSQSYTIPTQQPRRAIGNVRDKFIIKENGKWYERHYIARKIFDGTESWLTSVNSQFELSGTNYKKYKDGGTCISSHFIYSMELDTCVWIGNNSFILIRDKRYTNVNDFKAWLTTQYNAGTPVYVDYILETPLDIECTSEQTDILNQIYIKAKSYKGVTHIYSNDAVSPNCYVEAAKDLTTLL